MKRIYCLLFSAALTYGGAQNITGRVLDATTRQPIANASVAILDPPQRVETDSTGRFSLPVTEAGRYRVSARAAGYREQYLSVNGHPQQSAQLHFSLLPLREDLAEVTIRSVQPSREAPVAQTRLRQKDIEQVFAGQDAQFVLAQTAPSIITHSEAGTGFSNYGGLRLRGLSQSRLNFTLNGAPLNDMLDQGVFFSNFTDLANSLSGIQVQRGVGLSSHGSASFGGAINFESQNIWQPEAQAGLQLSAGSFDTYRASAEYLSGTLDSSWAFYGRMTNFTTNGYRYHSGTDSWSLFFKGGYRGERDLWQVTAFSGRSQSNLAYLPVPLSQIRQDPRSNSNFAQDRDNFGQQFAQLQYTRELSDSWHFSGSAYLGGAGGDFPFGLADSTGNFAGQINFPLQNRHYGGFGHLLYRSEKWRIKSGVHGYLFKRENWETFLPDNVNRLYSDRSQKSEISGFAQAQYTLGAFSLSADVQVRRVVMQFDPDTRFIAPGTAIPEYDYAFINPMLGLNWAFAERYTAYLSFGRSGREPTKFDLFGGSTRLDSANLSPLQDVNTVRPEFVNDWEAGLRYRNANSSWQMNFFWMDFRDKIEPIGERLVFVQLRKNVARSFRRGVELEGRHAFAGGMYLQGFASLIDGRIERYAPDNDDQNTVFTNVRPALTPLWQGRLTAGWQAPFGVDASLIGQFIGEQYLEPTNQENLTVPASAVLHTRISWSFAGEHQLVFRLNNLLDSRYYTYGEPSFDGSEPAYFVQPPRHFSLMLDLRF